MNSKLSALFALAALVLAMLGGADGEESRRRGFEEMEGGFLLARRPSVP